jgi:hypothetical protein
LNGVQKGRIWVVDIKLSFIGRRVVGNLEEEVGAMS